MSEYGGVTNDTVRLEQSSNGGPCSGGGKGDRNVSECDLFVCFSLECSSVYLLNWT